MKNWHSNDKGRSVSIGKILCILVIAAVVCAGNLIPNYLLSLKASGITKTSTTINNADVSPYTGTIAVDERLTKMMSLIQDNVNDLWNRSYQAIREPLDTEISEAQAFMDMMNFLEDAGKKQEKSGFTPMISESEIDILKKYESKYSGTYSSTETEAPVSSDWSAADTYEEEDVQYDAPGNTTGGYDISFTEFFLSSNISKELSAWVFVLDLYDTEMLVAVDAVLGVPFYITYYYTDMDDPQGQAVAVRNSYAGLYGNDYSMSDPKETDSKIDQFFVANAINAFYYGYTNISDDDYYTSIDPYVYYCSSDKVQMEYQVITRYQKYSKKGEDVSSYKSRINICLY